MSEAGSISPEKPTDVNRVIQYLHKIAPVFFEKRILPASEDDLQRLQEIAVRPLPKYHHDFLLAMGNTKQGVLDPFLNGRAFHIEMLIWGYQDLKDYGVCMPQEVSIFEASNNYSEYLFLKQNKNPKQPPEVGHLDFDKSEFYSHQNKSLEEYLLSFAFTFRIAQFEHIRAFQIKQQIALETCLAILQQMSFVPLFQIPFDRTCLEGPLGVVIVFSDGSGQLASHHLLSLNKICKALKSDVDISITLPPSRLFASNY